MGEQLFLGKEVWGVGEEAAHWRTGCLFHLGLEEGKTFDYLEIQRWSPGALALFLFKLSRSYLN